MYTTAGNAFHIIQFKIFKSILDRINDIEEF